MESAPEDIGSVSHWGYFCSEEMFGLLDNFEFQSGSPHRGVFFMSPHFVAISFADGVWDEVNARCGTTLAQYEEEDLSPAQTRSVAEAVLEISRQYVSGEIRRTVGWREETIRVPIVAEMAACEIRRLFEELSIFLVSLADEETIVIVSL
jgi:hypothetical protein